MVSLFFSIDRAMSKNYHANIKKNQTEMSFTLVVMFLQIEKCQVSFWRHCIAMCNVVFSSDSNFYARKNIFVNSILRTCKI